jgi:hypothetical protein
MVNWVENDLEAVFTQTALFKIEIVLEKLTAQVQIDQEQLARWFGEASPGQRATFAQHLLNPTDQAGLTLPEVAQVQRIFEQQLLNQAVPWQSSLVYLKAIKQ